MFWRPEFGGNNQKQIGITYSSCFTVGLLFECCFVALKRVGNCTSCIVTLNAFVLNLYDFGSLQGVGGGGGDPKQE